MSGASHTKMLRMMVCAVVLGAAVTATVGCDAEMGAAYPGNDYDDYPPDGYIATTEPVYFGGYASYWYGGRWYYRNGGRWNHYDREPAALYQRRFQAAPRQRNYEPSRGHSAGRSMGRGGGRSGGGHR
jgi:hypothetical protein